MTIDTCVAKAAGWEAANTRDASGVLKDYSSYASTLVGSAVEVSSVGGIVTLGPVTVAEA